MVVFKLPMLKYEYNALEPYVDTLTMSIHHSLEHEVYVQFTNEYVQKVRWIDPLFSLSRT